MNVKESVIAITGAGGGLGSGMARRLAGQGARLALLDYRADLMDGLVAELGLDEADLLVMACDVSNEEQVDSAFAGIVDHFGALDVLVNNAGITRDALTLKFRCLLYTSDAADDSVLV